MKREITKKNIERETEKKVKLHKQPPHTQLLPITINCQIEVINFVFQIEPSRAWKGTQLKLTLQTVQGKHQAAAFKVFKTTARRIILNCKLQTCGLQGELFLFKPSILICFYATIIRDFVSTS